MSAVLSRTKPTGLSEPVGLTQTPAFKASEADPVVQAIERLALTREGLRGAMMPPPRDPARGSASNGFTTHFIESVKSLPGASVVIDAVQAWWNQHPLHAAGQVAAEASRKLATPVAERNPLLLVFGALLVGALMAWIRPWRWLLRSALFAGLVPALVVRAIREVPPDSLVRLVALFTAPRASRHPAANPSHRSQSAATQAGDPVQAAPAGSPVRSPSMPTEPAAAPREASILQL